ncbi:MAG: hypothetical protein ABNH26_09785 [Celeribacter sp.]|jgi:hypothetical protein
MTKNAPTTAAIDPTRLMGFRVVAAADACEMGTKVGSKVGGKPVKILDLKVGWKPVSKPYASSIMAAKIGLKPD